MENLIADVVAAPWGWAAGFYLLTFLLTVAFLLVRSLLSMVLASRRCRLTENRDLEPAEGGFEFGRPDDEEVLVTLVHGTWGRRSPWHQPGSEFRRRLAGELRKRGFRARFRQFLWTGRNSVIERQRAARALRKDLCSPGGGSPEAPEFIIAHSHGGNVVVRALLRDHEEEAGSCADRIAGVSCLGVPFLVGSPRKRRIAPTLTVVLGPLLAAFVFATQPPLGLSRPADLIPDGVGGQSVVAGLLLGFVAAGLWIGLKVKGWLLPGTGLPGAIGRKLFVLRACGDEASGALGVAFMATWAVDKLTALLSLPLLALMDGAAAVVRGARRIFRVIAFVVAALAAVIALVGVMEPAVSGEAWAVAVVVLVLALSILVLPTIANGAVGSLRTAILVPVELVSQVVLGALLLPFGPELILASRFVMITSEAVPPVENGDRLAAVIQLGLRDGERASLQHTIYNHPRTPEYLAEWIARESRSAAEPAEQVAHERMVAIG